MNKNHPEQLQRDIMPSTHDREPEEGYRNPQPKWKISKIKKPHRLVRLFYVLALPIFPASRPASIVGADELNFCVRDGNRWTLIAINTNLFGWV